MTSTSENIQAAEIQETLSLFKLLNKFVNKEFTTLSYQDDSTESLQEEPSFLEIEDLYLSLTDDITTLLTEIQRNENPDLYASQPSTKEVDIEKIKSAREKFNTMMDLISNKLQIPEDHALSTKR